MYKVTRFTYLATQETIAIFFDYDSAVEFCDDNYNDIEQMQQVIEILPL